MTTEAPTTNPYSVEERMARIEAQQEIIIELLRDHNAKFDAINAKFDSINAKFDNINDRFDTKFDALNHRIFLAGIGIFSIVGAGVAAYIVNLLS
ncbi:MAG: hypothetical protein OXH22_03360 [Chloroflexi bacterium]|nr:hypothetical protein [Chloroflexota bacterium]